VSAGEPRQATLLGSDADWLGDLESRVHSAAERLKGLRQENRALAARVEELERRLAAAPPAGGEPGDAKLRARNQELEERLEGLWEELAAARREGEAAAERWGGEREEIRRRVEALTRQLEELASG
jgi:chromosome segregation ATPase